MKPQDMWTVERNLARSHIGVTSSPLALSSSPWARNSSLRLSAQRRAVASGRATLEISAPLRMAFASVAASRLPCSRSLRVSACRAMSVAQIKPLIRARSAAQSSRDSAESISRWTSTWQRQDSARLQCRRSSVLGSPNLETSGEAVARRNAFDRPGCPASWKSAPSATAMRSSGCSSAGAPVSNTVAAWRTSTAWNQLW
mmetsp:Transcript_26295/g.76673  ORF Transcript_26295/g.76673 Transcript_26295/m.76673 type:complete len:200 (+) Transcript_26295:234-833(+)